MNEKIALISGSSGFIGFHLAKILLEKDWQVIGIDCLNEYYDLGLKLNRQKILLNYKKFSFHKIYLEEHKKLKKVFKKYSPRFIFHFAAQAGVRYSLQNPKSYLDSNIIGTFNILEECSKYKIKHLLFASTSSVYGLNKENIFKETDRADEQISFYASSKKACETMTHCYSNIYKIPTTILRFFTVYGPWGRPDMALFKFTKSIIRNEKIFLYNKGHMYRDFTYIEDLIKSIYKLIYVSPKAPGHRKKTYENDSISISAPWRIVNIGNSKSIKLTEYVKNIENSLNLRAKIELIDIKPGDVIKTNSSNALLKSLTGFQPNTELKIGIEKFIKWYKDYNNI